MGREIKGAETHEFKKDSREGAHYKIYDIKNKTKKYFFSKKKFLDLLLLIYKKYRLKI